VGEFWGDFAVFLGDFVGFDCILCYFDCILGILVCFSGIYVVFGVGIIQILVCFFWVLVVCNRCGRFFGSFVGNFAGILWFFWEFCGLLYFVLFGWCFGCLLCWWLVMLTCGLIVRGLSWLLVFGVLCRFVGFV